MEKYKQQKLTINLFIIYLVILTWIILFKLQMPFQNLGGIRGINLIPFGASAVVNNMIDFGEIIYNIFVFIPLGMYISMLKKDWSFFNILALIAGVSLLYEILQYILAIGATDITDLITNTTGGIIGIGMYILFVKVFKTYHKADKVINVIAFIGMTCLIALTTLLFLFNL